MATDTSSLWEEVKNLPQGERDKVIRRLERMLAKATAKPKRRGLALVFPTLLDEASYTRIVDEINAHVMALAPEKTEITPLFRKRQRKPN